MSDAGPEQTPDEIAQPEGETAQGETVEGAQPLNPEVEEPPFVPPDPIPGCAVIWLHGQGETEVAWQSTFARFQVPESAQPCKWVWPRAEKITPCSARGGFPTLQWFDTPEFPICRVYRGLPDRYTRYGEDPIAVDEAVQRVHEAILVLEEEGVSADRIALAGFGQGGVLALHAMLRYPRKLACGAVLSGYLACAEDLFSRIQQQRFKAETAREQAIEKARRDLQRALDPDAFRNNSGGEIVDPKADGAGGNGENQLPEAVRAELEALRTENAMLRQAVAQDEEGVEGTEVQKEHVDGEAKEEKAGVDPHADEEPPGDPEEIAERLKDLEDKPVPNNCAVELLWLHGARDAVVEPQMVLKDVQKVKELGTNIDFRLFPEAGYGICNDQIVLFEHWLADKLADAVHAAGPILPMPGENGPESLPGEDALIRRSTSKERRKSLSRRSSTKDSFRRQSSPGAASSGDESIRRSSKHSTRRRSTLRTDSKGRRKSSKDKGST